ncbi:MAG: hypothetical protein JWN62_3578 [Acidimicrobiales bacterium]|nr:hypothetical protein [Acidimicrobiales bacterium]
MSDCSAEARRQCLRPRSGGYSVPVNASRSISSLPSAADLAELRALLVHEAARSSEQAAALSASFEAIVGAAELVNTDDEHDPEGTTIAFERAQITALHRQALADVESIGHALDRLDAGTYGACETCGQPIGIDRLTALPASIHCVSCA